MDIIQYPHPTLRHKSKPLRKVDAKIKSIVAEMFEAMYAARGIGLAANQVDLPFRLFVINTTGTRGEGEERVFINPVVSKPKGTDEAEEGCLSLVGLNAKVVRPAQVHIHAYDLSGNEIDQVVDGILAKAIQHECDHLDGVLFIDRVSDSTKVAIEGELQDFELVFDSQRNTGEIPDDETILARLKALENEYC